MGDLPDLRQNAQWGYFDTFLWELGPQLFKDKSRHPRGQRRQPWTGPDTVGGQVRRVVRGFLCRHELAVSGKQEIPALTKVKMQGVQWLDGGHDERTPS